MPCRVVRAGAGVRTGVGVLLGVAEGVALGMAVAVRVGAVVLVGLGVTDGVATVAVTGALGDGEAPLAPRTVPSQPVRVAPRHSRIAMTGRYLVRSDGLLDNGDPPQDEVVAHWLTSQIGHWQAGAGGQ